MTTNVYWVYHRCGARLLCESHGYSACVWRDGMVKVTHCPGCGAELPPVAPLHESEAGGEWSVKAPKEASDGA